MYEVEVKVSADHDEVRKRLSELGADPVNEVTQVDTYYDAPHREFAETDEALRVRREDPANADEFAELTYKGPLVETESKTREEIETVVENGEATGDLLSALGFDPAATVRKNRERFLLGGYTVTLDAVDGLGEFVEIETEVEDESEVESAREEAYSVLRDLGLDPEKQIRTSYLGLLLSEEDGT